MVRFLLSFLLFASFSVLAQEHEAPEDSPEDVKLTFEADYPEDEDASYTLFNTETGGGLFGVFRNKDSSSGNYSSYNPYIWEAALEVVSLFPLSQIDSVSGVVLTEWYSEFENPDVRIKVDVYILGDDLKPESLQVSVFKEFKAEDNNWSGLMKRSKTQSASLKLTILRRARALFGRDVMSLETK